MENIFFKEIIANQIFCSVSLSWIIAQTIKMALYYSKNRKLNFRLLVGTGGMPSAHSALVCAMATMVGLKEGWGSTYFMIALCLALVIMTDAAGVRRASGKQAMVLNRLVDEYYAGKGIKQDRLRELLGHTPTEVFAGSFIGIIVSVIVKALPKFV